MPITTEKGRGWLHNWLSRRQQAGQTGERKVSSVRLQLEQLESRDLLSGTWTILNHLAPTDIGTMMLLTDGTVIAQESGVTKQWERLTPDALGSYVNGTWSSIASMNAARQYFGSNVLPSGKVFVVGGENTDQGTQANTNLSETYDPVADKWITSATFPQSHFGDDPTEILPNGNIRSCPMSIAACAAVF